MVAFCFSPICLSGIIKISNKTAEIQFVKMKMKTAACSLEYIPVLLLKSL